MTGLNLDTIECADVMDYLRGLPDACVNLVVTSPPYFGLRDYGTAAWDGGDPACDHVNNAKATKKFGNPEFNANRPSREETKTAGYYASVCPKCGARRIDQQIGLEATPAAYVARMVDVFREVKRVIRDDASVYVNLGDSFGSGEIGRNDAVQERTLDGRPIGKQRATNERQQARRTSGLPPKSLMLIPHRFAIAMQDDGWLLREDIVWQKPNPMPESVRDRCTRSHEYIFHFTKGPRYWYDAQAVSEPVTQSSIDRAKYSFENSKDRSGGSNSPDTLRADQLVPAGGLRNRRSVWTINPANFKSAHFATFPEDIPEICIKAACPEWCCDQCGAPYEAQVERVAAIPQRHSQSLDASRNDTARAGGFYDAQINRTGYAPSCTCNAGKRAGVVMDIFMGAGTVGLVAKKLNRRYIGCDLNAEYVKMATDRINGISYTLFSLMEVTGD
jgi:DNA modification methylase